MKQFVLSFLSFILALSASAQGEAVFTGKILKYQGDDLLFCYVQSDNKRGYDTLQIDKKGCFSLSRTLDKSTQMIMFWEGRGVKGGDAACILLESGKKVQCEVSIVGEAPKNKMQVTFKGKNMAKQVYTNQFYQHFSRRSEFSEDKIAAFGSLKEFNAYADEVMGDMYTSLASVKDDALFVEKAHSTLESQKSRYRFDYAKYREQNGFHMRDDADFMAIVGQIDANDTNQVAQLSNVLEWKVVADADKYQGLNHESAFLSCLRDMTSNVEVRNRVASNVFQSVLFLATFGANPSDLSFKPLYEQFLLTSTDEQQCAFCRDQLANMAATAPGNAPVDFELVDTNDKPLSFAELIKEGAVTYFDFWATWCGPCKREIPKLATLVEQYKGNPKVRIISISIDADHDAWKKMVAADKPQWEQYLIPALDTSDGIKKYNISSIPRFMLFGTDGKLVDGNAKRPSDPAIKQQIDELIK